MNDGEDFVKAKAIALSENSTVPWQRFLSHRCISNWHKLSKP